MVSVKLPDGSPFERTLEVSKIIENAGIETEKYYENKDNSIENTYINATGSSIRAYFNLYSPSDRKASATEIADILRDKIGDIPDAEGLDVSKDIGRNPTDADLNFNITATKSEDLIPALNDFINNLRSYSATYDVRNSLNSSFTEIQISVRPNAEKLGLTLGEISRQLRQAYYGEEVQRLPRNGEDVKVMVHYPKKLRRSLDSLSKFRIRTPDGREVPFLSVASIQQSPGVQKIERIDGLISASVSTQIRGDFKTQILTELKEDYLPGWKTRFPSASWRLGGESEGEDEFFAEIRYCLLYTSDAADEP